jgi:hypothetical protein
MPIIGGAEKVNAKGVGRGEIQVSSFLYDFGTDGGAVSTIALRSGDAPLPSGARVTDALIIVETIPVGATATISVGVEAAADVQAAAAISGAPWSTTGSKRASALTATTAPVVLTAARTPSIAVAVAPLTAGKFKLILSWFEYDSTEV